MANLYYVPPTYKGPATVTIGSTTYTATKVPTVLNSYQNVKIGATDNIVVSNQMTGTIRFEASSNVEGQTGQITLEAPAAGSPSPTYNVAFNDPFFGGSLNPTITVPDGARMEKVNIDGAETDSMTVRIGKNVTFGDITGGNEGGDKDTLVIGDNSTVGNISLGDGHDVLDAGQNVTFKNIVMTDTLVGASQDNDVVKIGSGSKFGDLRVGNGNDNVTLGDNVSSSGLIRLGSGDDVLTAGTGAKLTNIEGLDGNDRITLGDDAKVSGTIDTGAGDDVVELGHRTVVTGDVSMQDGKDALKVGDGASLKNIFMGSGDDTVTLGDNNKVTGETRLNTGNDVLVAGKGLDANKIDLDHELTTFEGNANDSATFGDGLIIRDGLYAGSGNDTVSVGTVAGNGAGGKASIRMGTENPSGINNPSAGDTLFVRIPPNDGRAVFKALQEQNWSDTAHFTVGGAENPAGDGQWSDGSTQNRGFKYGEMNVENVERIIGPMCFTVGTMILTDRGEVAIETLAPGDLVQTRDNGLQPIRWIGRRVLLAAELHAHEQMRPVRITRGALGNGCPAADLVVSPQHRVLVRSKIAQKMFGAPEVLVAAKQLCQVDGIDIADDIATVEYVHLLFDRHEVVFSNGAETESLYTGPEALKSVGPAAIEEIFALFPELRDRSDLPDAARMLVSGRMGRKLAVRHIQNGKPLIQ